MYASLKDAARRAGIPADEVRRKILTGEIAALPVDDDRQYLVRLEDLGIKTDAPAEGRPATRAPYLCLRLAFGLFLLTLLAAIVTTAVGTRCCRLPDDRGRDALCLSCGIVRHDAGRHASYEADSLTDALGLSECSHQWVSLYNRAGRSVRVLAEEMNRLGIVEAARKVDPRGAAELVRWCLGREWGAYLEKASFTTREEFGAWFADLRARAAH